MMHLSKPTEVCRTEKPPWVQTKVIEEAGGSPGEC